MSLYARGNIWWCEWRIGGTKVRETTGTADRKAAQEYHDRRRAELWRSTKLGEHAVSFDAAAVAWWEDYASKKRSAETDLIRLRRVAKRFTGKPLTQIDTPALDRFALAIQKEGLAPSTVNKTLSIASGILRRAARKGWIPHIPEIPWVFEPETDYEWLSQDEAADLIPLLPPNLRQLARFSLMTGLRRENATHLEWARVDLDRSVCWIVGEDSKNGKALPIPLNADAIGILREQEGKHKRWCFPYRGNAVTHTTTKAWVKAVTTIGRPTVTWHDLRHTWASWHVQGGTDLRVLMQLGGWSDIQMVMRYAHLAPGFAAAYAGNVSFTKKRPTIFPTARFDDSEEDSQLPDTLGWLTGLEPATTGITIMRSRKKA